MVTACEDRKGPAVLGMVFDPGIVDVGRAWADLRREPVPSPLLSMLTFLESGDEGLQLLDKFAAELMQRGVEPYLLNNPRLLAPLPRPKSIRDCMAFPEHLLQSTRGGATLLYPAVGKFDHFLTRIFGRGFLSVPGQYYKMPVYYKGNPASVIGPDETILWPSYTRLLDYELEFGVFINRMGRDIPERDADSYIGGYTIFNDVSARDTQLEEMKLRLGPAKGKDFDTGNVMGPWLVTPDEVGDPYQLAMSARVDGEVWSQNTSAGMAFSFAEIISYISRSETLYPGDFIGAGTVGGGCGLEHGRWLGPGQTIELSVERLGTLRSYVGQPSPR